MTSLLTVVNASLGNIKFSIFDVIEDKDLVLVGVLMVMVILIVYFIMMINLLIAMLSNTYNLFDSKSNGLYLSKILVSRDEMTYNESYGSFIIAIPVINLL